MNISTATPATPLPPTASLILPAWLPESREPIRTEASGLESLEVHARRLAAACRTAAHTTTEGPLLQRVPRNGRILVAAHRRIAAAAEQHEVLTSDAEWLLDNFYIVEEVLREVQHDLPRGYYRKLPKLADGPLAGYPRIYPLALALIGDTDSSLDDPHITRFVQAYQTVTPLTIGELWAVPTMLRLGLLENLCRLAERMLQAWDEHRRAEAWIAPLLQQARAGGGPANLVQTLPGVPFSDAFVVHALEVLGHHVRPAVLAQVKEYLSSRGIDFTTVVRRENHRQAVNQVSVGNCMTSLRLLSALDWNVFFETTSLVEPLLRQDPIGAYERQDFVTRDRYRQAVERLSRRTGLHELEVCQRLLQRARAGQQRASRPQEKRRLGHIGYYLLGPGQDAFKKELRYRPRLDDLLLGTLLHFPRTIYFGLIAGLSGGLLFLLALLAWPALSAAGPVLTVLVLLAALLPVSELAVGLTNHLLILVLPPRTLPRLEFKEGIPPDCATFVVMPCMLDRPESAAGLTARLQLHYLANPDPQLRFALLTDFADAPVEQRPEEEEYVRDALARIAALNRRYVGDGPPRFFLFHRRRQWNAAEGCWMGWERKRGKLEEFNRLLRGDPNTSYAVRSSPLDGRAIRYVITLDLDTQLPHETARRLVGTLAHPLNQPRFDPAAGRVVEGYSVLQPRISLHVPAAHRSRFTRIWATSAGVDPYSTAVSDIYMDLFGTGSFTGKGIYEVDAFSAATGHTFPSNHILSHDLIEGNYARCGLVTDIELFDDFPVRYHAYARREHRWIRGDWQLLPWLSRHTPIPEQGDTDRTTRPNPLPLLERWKIVDNLRRSLVSPAVVLWLVLAWTVLPVPLGLSTALAVLVLALPLLLQIMGTVVQTAGQVSLAPVRDFVRSSWTTACQVLLGAVVLLNQAYLAVDAIVRTLVRLGITRRHLLEWETAAAADRRLGTGLGAFVKTMWASVLLAVALAVLVAVVNPGALGWAGPFLVAWLVAPGVACWISQDRLVPEVPLAEQERGELGLLARKTWGFFETFVGPEDNWLPPDNFQEEPRGQVAHRTSPTNKGLLLLSTLAAHDLGYLTLGGLLDRLGHTLETLGRLERYRGHFYNWYSTTTLQALTPGYVSTVDSGNMQGCLLTLAQALHERAREPIPCVMLLNGLRTTTAVVAESLECIKNPEKGEAGAALEEVQISFQAVRTTLGAPPPQGLRPWVEWLERLRGQTQQLASSAERFAVLVYPPCDDLRLWTRRLADHVEQQCSELAELAPWLPLLADPRSDKLFLTQGKGDAKRIVRWHIVRDRLLEAPCLIDCESEHPRLRAELDALAAEVGENEELADWLGQLSAAVQKSSAAKLLDRCRKLAEQAESLALEMDFRFLYKPDRHLFAIGYNVPQKRLDAACYDLLASEARLASFLAIARGHAPRRHWFHLGRAFVVNEGEMCLVSWGGTMFEYLMPQLLLRRYPNTLLDESCRGAVDRQIAYGRERGVPWGISESAFSSHSVSFDYQYQAFGVPGLGLKRGLAQDLVIAPYAAALAVIVRPHEAAANFRQLRKEGAWGRFGFYEAVDYTRRRLPEGHRSLVVRCFMAHHQGMSLVAVANCLLSDIMVRRFHAVPLVRATELLLQERVPSAVLPVDTPQTDSTERPPPSAGGQDILSRRLTTPDMPWPRAHLLSNSDYCVMVTNAGAGFSRCRGLDVTRWREDGTRDDHGLFVYVRDLRSGTVWSAGHQPVCRRTDHYEVVYSTDKADFYRVDGPIATHLEVTVSPEHTVEVRRVTLTNNDTLPHDLELTSYAEIVLAPHAADLAHPAFGKLFLETEWVPSHMALLCRRRPRAREQEPVWGLHVSVVEGRTAALPQVETDRARFLGRGRTPAAPAALDPGARLSGTTGAVLDPIFSLRQHVHLQPGASVAVLFCTGVAANREDALILADHFRDQQGVGRVFDLAFAHSQVELRNLQLSTAEAHLFQRLVSHLLYPGPALRAAPAVLAANRQGQPGLWRYGISGDLPILLVRIHSVEDVPLVRHLLLAHTFWRLKGVQVDLVILSEDPSGYLEELHQSLQEAVRSSHAHHLVDRPGGVFLRMTGHMTDEDQVLLQAAARVVLLAERGPLSMQLATLEEQAEVEPPRPEPIHPEERPAHYPPQPGLSLPEDLLFPNGHGGFTPDGREYCILPYEKPKTPPAGEAQQPAGHLLGLPPAPWINVIANPSCGFLVSESGLGYSWVGNSQQYRLTPWYNDQTADPPGEVLYLRDTQTGEYWTPTPRPLGLDAPTLVRHGQGYTRFEQHSHGLRQELCVFVPPEDPIKLIVLRVRNTEDRPRKLSATFFAEWVLGTVRDQAAMNVRTQIDLDSGALLACNPFAADYAGWVAFADVSLRPRTLSGDRAEFLGRNGSLMSPAALFRKELSGRTGAGLDTCAALQAPFDLEPGAEFEVVFFLGGAEDVATVRRLLERYREPGRVQAALQEATALWERILTAVQVATPDPGMDVLLNRWLLYQALSCRVWGRSALYQSGGAYGYRDQLQDSMALVYGAREEARAHLLRAAARQFVEGDVQHWWHPPAGKGIRTHFSDDYLWLPFVVSHYVATTGDAAVLDEHIPFLVGPALPPDKEEDYGQPRPTDETATLYEHCVRALRHGFRFGAHGLPLMGTGDWNDGMNRVGSEGKGESVWVGWFLASCLRRFADLAEGRGDRAWASTCREQAEAVRQAIEAQAWDGGWYRRAYFDDGTLLGSAENDECQIDSIAQSWAVLSGAGEPERAKKAMAAVDERLVRREDELILLFTPPFDHGKLEPGYIKGYVPGIRENGGQYTHAATWVVQAAGQLGQGRHAKDLFDLLSPVRHTATPEQVARYCVEPYVVVADVYGHPPHVGRGGWTWYTGSASWLYRVGLETLLGFHLRGDRLVIDPCIPADWKSFSITCRHHSATYRITVDNPGSVERGVAEVVVDGQVREDRQVPLTDDGGTHEVRVRMG
jgi:cyclic beta-1,2-glucan synthetase